jgi:hypothetical protein
MATATNSGYKAEILNVAVGTGTWTPVTLTLRPNNILVKLRESGSIKVSLDAAGATYVTVPDGTSMTLDWNAGRSGDIIYLEASVSGTAEIFVTYE